MRKEEKWAQQIIQQELKRTVTVNDDGSAPGMCDLRVGPPDAPHIAIEVIRAIDQTLTETWHTGPAKGPLRLSTKGDWTVTIAANARIKTVRQHIQRILQTLENRGIHSVFVDYQLRTCDAALFDELDSLRIKRVRCYRLPGTGQVHMTMPGEGGAVNGHGSSVPEWISTFLRDPVRQDVLSKLQNSGAASCHVFVLVEFGGAPFPVEWYLQGDLSQTPNQPPDLPSPVSEVWVASLFDQGKGIRWDGSTWLAFRTRGEGMDE
jgi:hypothetical protein